MLIRKREKKKTIIMFLIKTNFGLTWVIYLYQLFQALIDW